MIDYKKIIITIFIITLLLTSCSNDKSKKSDSSTTTANNKSNTTSTKKKTEFEIKQEKMFQEEVSGLKSLVKTSCANIKTAYTNYLMPNQTSDGKNEIVLIGDEINNLYIYINQKMHKNQWSDFEFTNPEGYYKKELVDYTLKINEFSSRLAYQERVLVDQFTRTVESNNEINTITTEFNSLTNARDFGPCNIL